MSGGTFHARFAAALTDAELPPPDALSVRDGDDVARGFAVYRNNVMVSLIDALAARFPVTARLVGGDFFRAMARAFIHDSPPDSPLLTTYGDDLPRFIEGFHPAGSVPYLADVARLEAARTRACHAADASPLARDAFKGWSGERLAAARLTLHPSAEALSSSYAVATIWSAHQDDDIPEGLDPDAPEDVLIARPDMEVKVHLLPPGGAAFIARLQDGATLGRAAASAADEVPSFDAAQALAAVIAADLVVGVTDGRQEAEQKDGAE